MVEVKVVADSLSPVGHRLTTMQLRYPRFIHAEFLTHRMFSRNASSSRAIPVDRMIEQVLTDPAMPLHWGRNQTGMQAREELPPDLAGQARETWLLAANRAAELAKTMMAAGLHKQVANRILEPFQFIHVVVTSTDWDNFFELRCHPDAQPEFQALALAMREALDASFPRPRCANDGDIHCWHLPYLTDEERADRVLSFDPFVAAAVSAARCARVSYRKHDGTTPSLYEDLQLFQRLAGGRPLHASPLEHQAVPAWLGASPSVAVVGSHRNAHTGNFNGWRQFRKFIELRKVDMARRIPVALDKMGGAKAA